MGFLHSYYNPISKNNNYVCGNCWDKLNESESKYSKFISNSTSKESGIDTFFVLIICFPKKEKIVFDKLSKIPNITDIEPIQDKSNIIIKINIENLYKLDEFLIHKIRQINGIKKTMTLTGFHSLENIKNDK